MRIHRISCGNFTLTPVQVRISLVAPATEIPTMNLIQVLLASLISTLVRPLQVLPNRDALDLSIGNLIMTLQKRTSAPGKARREASKGKPRRAVVAKAAKKSAPAPRSKSASTGPRTASKATPRKSGEFKPTTTVRYSDRDAVPATRKEARLTDRSKLRAARFQKEIGSKSKEIEGAPKGNPRQSASERVFEKGGRPKPKTRAEKFVSDRNERPDRRTPDRSERSERPRGAGAAPKRSFDKPARSFDKPERTSRPADRSEPWLDATSLLPRST